MLRQHILSVLNQQETEYEEGINQPFLTVWRSLLIVDRELSKHRVLRHPRRLRLRLQQAA